jgi:phosphoribosylanthranilate isomerase
VLTLLKICGITRAQDLDTCEQLGVHAVGFNFWRRSPRCVSMEAAVAMSGLGARHGALRVGVFVDPSEDEIREATSRLHLDAIQLHGDAPIERYAGLGLPLVWVIRGTPELTNLAVPQPAPRWILLDARVAGYGGAGVTTDWEWAARAVEHFAPLPVWLAGGLSPENAGAAIECVAPAGIDVASGAEGDVLGVKVVDKIAALVAACSKERA